MSVEDNKTIGKRWINEIWQEASSAAINELFAADFTYNYVPPGSEPNREGYKKSINEYHVGFPDIQFTIDDVVAEGNKVAVHWSGRGTHQGEYWGIAPTGKPITFQGISILQIEDGKIVEEWGYDNAWSWMEQLGMFD